MNAIVSVLRMQHGDRLGRGRRDLLRVERDLGQQERRPSSRRRTASAGAAGGRHASQRRSNTTREPIHASPYSLTYEPMPRRTNTPTISTAATARSLGVDGADVVEQRLDELQHHHVGRRDEQHADDRDREHAPVRTHVAEQPAIELQGRRRTAGRERAPIISERTASAIIRYNRRPLARDPGPPTP